jgi:hypothetical protein
MALTKSVLVSTPVLEPEGSGYEWLNRPFRLQIDNIDVRLSYAELSKLMADADGEIRDYLGEEHV